MKELPDMEWKMICFTEIKTCTSKWYGLKKIPENLKKDLQNHNIKPELISENLPKIIVEQAESIGKVSINHKELPVNLYESTVNSLGN